VLDSLEEVHALSDGAENDLEFLQSLLDDKSLHSMLEVRSFKRKKRLKSETQQLYANGDIRSSGDSIATLVSVLGKFRRGAIFSVRKTTCSELLSVNAVVRQIPMCKFPCLQWSYLMWLAMCAAGCIVLHLNLQNIYCI